MGDIVTIVLLSRPVRAVKELLLPNFSPSYASSSRKSSELQRNKRTRML